MFSGSGAEWAGGGGLCEVEGESTLSVLTLPFNEDGLVCICFNQ